MTDGATDPAVCDYCGLPTGRRSRRRPDDGPCYCCFGCRFAAGVAQEAGEVGQMRWTLTRLGMAIFFSMNVMVFTLVLWTQDVYQADLGGAAAQAASLNQLFRYLCLLFALPVLLLLGGPLLESALAGLRQRVIGTDLLLLTGVVAAVAYSVVSVVRGEGHIYFEVSSMVLVAVTLGRWLEATGKWKTTEALQSLQTLLPETVRVVSADGERSVALERVAVGDLVRVLPGDRFPTDGRIESGETSVDQQVLTGESRPVVRAAGDRVGGGSLNLDGDVTMAVTALPGQGTLGRLVQAVRDAAATKGPYQRLADRLARWFLPVVIAVAAATVAVHAWRGDLETAILAGLAVVLIACPCALAVATPMALWAALGRASRSQILFRSGESLAALASARAICFDKTGTLTTGSAEVDACRTDDSTPPGTLHGVASCLAATSRHGLASAVGRYSTPRAAAPVPTAHAARTLPGRGVTADVRPDIGMAWLGSPRWMEESDQRMSDPLSAATRSGQPITCLAWGGRVRAVFALREELRESARPTIEWLHREAFHVEVLTGDHRPSGERLAERLGVDVEAQLLPDEKLTAIRTIRDRTGPVVMVGEGLNDAPALAGADVGVAMGCGADVSRQSADVCLLGNDLRQLPWAILLARRTVRTIRRNLFWAFSYNVVGISLAAIGWLNPIVAAVAMIASSCFVIAGSLQLARDDAPPAAIPFASDSGRGPLGTAQESVDEVRNSTSGDTSSA